MLIFTVVIFVDDWVCSQLSLDGAPAESYPKQVSLSGKSLMHLIDILRIGARTEVLRYDLQKPRQRNEGLF